MLLEFDKIFSVEHVAFYNELKEWRKEYLDNQNINECVYILMTNKSVPRVLKSDSKGLLYIGKGLLTKNHERIGELINSVNSGTSKQHEAGGKYQRISNKYEIEGLSLGIMLVRNLENKSRDIEEDLLIKYLNKFGELPPLNRQA